MRQGRPRQVKRDEKFDDSEPTPERQAELRSAYKANMAAGSPPYDGVTIRTRGELQSVMRELGWSGRVPSEGRERVNLSGADLQDTNLSGVELAEANLSGVDFSYATLSYADLSGANLSRATLLRADLSDASLEGANLKGTNLGGANLSGAHMRRAEFDSETSLENVTASSRGHGAWAVGDVRWGGVDLTSVNWDTVSRLGDERYAGKLVGWLVSSRVTAANHQPYGEQTYRAVVRAYRQMAAQLRVQGMNEVADRFAYRAQVCQRSVLLRQWRVLQYAGSRLLDLISGYGYKPMRSFLTYLLVVLGFAAAYFALGGANGKPLTWNEAIVVSMTAFHGRGFFAAVFQPGDIQAAVAAVEAFIGLLIEIVFIATFTQRFFAR